MRNWLIKIFLLLICVFSFFIYSSKEVFASCKAPVPLSEYKEWADIIVLGKVTSYDGLIANVSVDKYFKGHGGPSQIKVTGKLSPDTNQISSVDFEMYEGKKYLLFLRTGVLDVLKTNNCDGNKEVLDNLSEEDLKVLGTGYSPSGNTQDVNYSDLNKVVWPLFYWTHYNLFTFGGVAILIVGTLAGLTTRLVLHFLFKKLSNKVKNLISLAAGIGTSVVFFI